MIEYLSNHDSVLISIVTLIIAVAGYLIKKVTQFDIISVKVIKHETIIEHLDTELVKLERDLLIFSSEQKSLIQSVDLLKTMIKDNSNKLDFMKDSVFSLKFRDLETQQSSKKLT